MPLVCFLGQECVLCCSEDGEKEMVLFGEMGSTEKISRLHNIPKVVTA